MDFYEWEWRLYDSKKLNKSWKNNPVKLVWTGSRTYFFFLQQQTWQWFERHIIAKIEQPRCSDPPVPFYSAFDDSITLPIANNFRKVEMKWIRKFKRIRVKKKKLKL